MAKFVKKFYNKRWIFKAYQQNTRFMDIILVAYIILTRAFILKYNDFIKKREPSGKAC